MDEVNKEESHMTSAAAFVEGGIQEACDDSCSICLEDFCESDPSTVTTCKHEFHLQCILEWCQRSSNCPMCWQAINLKDPSSQELLEAVERERHFRSNPARNATIFHHPTLGDFELQHLPAEVNDAELEDRIFQHLAAAAAMGRARHLARREGLRSRSSPHGRPQYLVFSTHDNTPATGPASASVAPLGADLDLAAIAPVNPSLPQTAIGSEPTEYNPQFSPVPNGQLPASSSGSMMVSTNPQQITCDNSSARRSPLREDRAGPSDFQSIPESWKSRLNAMSMKYKETISKSTRGWKEKLFSRSATMADIGSEVRREVNAGIASVSRMMERLEARENSRGGPVPVARENGRGGPVSASDNPVGSPVTEQSIHNSMQSHDGTPVGDTSAFAAGSVSR